VDGMLTARCSDSSDHGPDNENTINVRRCVDGRVKNQNGVLYCEQNAPSPPPVSEVRLPGDYYISRIPAHHSSPAMNKSVWPLELSC
jgi:hypothetical protein